MIMDKMEGIRRGLERMMKSEGYRYAGEGDSPYTQEFVDRLRGKKTERDDGSDDDHPS